MKVQCVATKMIRHKYQVHDYKFGMDQQGWQKVVGYQHELQLQMEHLDFSNHYTCILQTVTNNIIIYWAFHKKISVRTFHKRARPPLFIYYWL